MARRFRIVLGLLVGLFLVAPAAGTVLTALVGAIAFLVRCGGRAVGPPVRLLPGCVLACWIVGLAAVTPLYTPYARLLLPLLSGCWLGVGLGAQYLVTVSLGECASWTRRQQTLLVGASLAALGLAGYLWAFPAGAGGDSRTAARDVARWVQERLQAERLPGGKGPGAPRAAVYVYGEPGVVFHLRRQTADVKTIPVSHLRFADPQASAAGLPVYLLVGPHAHESPAFREQFRRASAQLQNVAAVEATPSLLVALDRRDADRRPAWFTGQAPPDRYELLRLRPVPPEPRPALRQ